SVGGAQVCGRGAREGKELDVADARGEPRDPRVREVAAGRGVTADEPGVEAVRGRIKDVGEPTIPVAVVEDDAPGGVLIHLEEGASLGLDIARGPGRVGGGEGGGGRLDVGVAVVGRVA